MITEWGWGVQRLRWALFLQIRKTVKLASVKAQVICEDTLPKWIRGFLQGKETEKEAENVALNQSRWSGMAVRDIHRL